jgi:hypothetical protein
MSLQVRMKTMALARAKEKAIAEEAAQACKRRSRRKETSLPAMLTFHNMRLTVPCTVADMSGSGAKLSFPSTMQQQFGDMEHLPERCVLVLTADRMQVEIQIMWRRSGQVGVRFLSPPKPLPAARR